MTAPSSGLSHLFSPNATCYFLNIQISRRFFSIKLSKMMSLVLAQEWHFSIPSVLGTLCLSSCDFSRGRGEERILIWFGKRQLPVECDLQRDTSYPPHRPLSNTSQGPRPRDTAPVAAGSNAGQAALVTMASYFSAHVIPSQAGSHRQFVQAAALSSMPANIWFCQANVNIKKLLP